jgi:hypothetical protein
MKLIDTDIARNLKHYPMTDITVTSPYERGRR